MGIQLFLDTASIDEIREINRWGVLGGVTTNPSLVAKTGSEAEQVWKEILEEVDGDISLEVTDLSSVDAMVEQGRVLAAMGENAVVKVPMTTDGLAAGSRLVSQGIRINVTLVFSAAQAILAAQVGATYVSPFLGRLDDVGSDGVALLADICHIYSVQGFETKVLAASLRHPSHVIEAARVGADVATMPFSVFKQLVAHPLTEAGLEKFSADWNASRSGSKG